MEIALEGIEELLRSEPIVLTLELLKHATRFRVVVSFIADTGLKKAADIGKFFLSFLCRSILVVLMILVR